MNLSDPPSLPDRHVPTGYFVRLPDFRKVSESFGVYKRSVGQHFRLGYIEHLWEAGGHLGRRRRQLRGDCGVRRRGEATYVHRLFNTHVNVHAPSLTMTKYRMDNEKYRWSEDPTPVEVDMPLDTDWVVPELENLTPDNGPTTFVEHIGWSWLSWKYETLCAVRTVFL